MFIEYLWNEPTYYVTWVAVITFSICIHEAMHTWVAMTQGDMTAYRQGYFTLNPLKVMGPHSLIMLLLIGLAWGAVPVNHRAMRHRSSPALVACSGPGANLGLALCFGTLAALFVPHANGEVAELFLYVFSVGLTANCFLFLLNMLPIPLFDGWELYAWFFPQLQRMEPQKKTTISWILLLILFISPGLTLLRTGAHGLGSIIFHAVLTVTGAAA